jgi:thiamine biosynthesis lipoprotein
MPLSKLNSKPKPRLNHNEVHSFGFEAIGTQWQIIIEQPVNQTLLTDLITAIKARIERFDQHYSRFRSDSLVSSMAQKAGNYKLPEDAKPLFDLYRQLYDISEGRMTPLIGQLLVDAGYDAKYSLQPKALQATPKWSEALDYKFPELMVKQPVLLDLGAAGKGYLVDIVGRLIEAAGITQFCINAGGDILSHNVSAKLSKIGLEHPLELDQAIGLAKVSSGSLCGSAGNRRTWGGFHHIINPHTKNSPDHILAAWVVADTTLLADGLATALFFTEAPKLKDYFDFEHALISRDLSLEYSTNFPAEFFIEERREGNLAV